jgi:hypothetical protein
MLNSIDSCSVEFDVIFPSVASIVSVLLAAAELSIRTEFVTQSLIDPSKYVPIDTVALEELVVPLSSLTSDVLTEDSFDSPGVVTVGLPSMPTEDTHILSDADPAL